MAAKKTRSTGGRYVRLDRQVFAIEDLEPAPYNARSITQESLRGLAESLTRFGVLAPPIVNVAHDPPRIIGGHQRIRAMREADVTEVECIVVNFDDLTEQRANFALNNPYIEGEFIPELTRALLDEIAKDAPDAGELMKDLRLDALLKSAIRNARSGEPENEVKEGEVDDDEIPSYTQKGVVSKLGQTYMLGDHRLLCGRLKAPSEIGKPAHMALTCVRSAKLWSNDALWVLLSHVLMNTDGGVYVATDDKHLSRVAFAFEAAGAAAPRLLLAHDRETSPSASKHFQPAALPLLYGCRSGAARGFYGPADASDVWRLKSRLKNGSIPVEIAVLAMQNSSVAGNTVLDPNVTDGSTVIAAEKMGRRITGIVPTAREMDLVRRRWTRFVKGEKADWKTATKAVRG